MSIVTPRAKADLAVWQGILISAASLTIGWLVYDFLCKSRCSRLHITHLLLLSAANLQDIATKYVAIGFMV